jgi:hypothetical protein
LLFIVELLVLFNFVHICRYMQKETQPINGKSNIAFVDPGLLARNVIDSDRGHVIQQMVKAIVQYADKDIVMCPYNPCNHWILVVFSVKLNCVWYVDPLRPRDGEGTLLTRDFSEVKRILDEYVIFTLFYIISSTTRSDYIFP